MNYFFDTSALQHRYIDGPKARGVRRLISDRRNTCFIAELSILEISSALARHCRKNGLTPREYQKRDQAFWKDIHEKRIHVYPVGKREYVRARDLLRYAGVDKARNIKSADALIATSCHEFALNASDRVTFCLEDWKLFDVLRDLSSYKSVLRFHSIGVDKKARTGTVGKS
jgi:hypothetical protein